jgi:hypothetical protein
MVSPIWALTPIQRCLTRLSQQIRVLIQLSQVSQDPLSTAGGVYPYSDFMPTV